MGHLSYKVATHLLAGINTIENLVQTSLIVLPKCERVAIWNLDGGTLVVPSVPQKCPKVYFCSFLSFLDLNRKRIASAIVIFVDIGNWNLNLLWRRLELDVGHLLVKVTINLLAGIKTIEHLVQTSLIWVLPKCEGEAIWHLDRCTLVVPKVVLKCPKVHLCGLLSILKLNRKRVASAIVIYEDIGSR